MNLANRICDLTRCPNDVYAVKPSTLDRGPVPTQPVWRENVFILSYAVAPLLVQQASYRLLPTFEWPFIVAFPFYVSSLIYFALATIKRTNYYAVRFGTFDEKRKGRDPIPANSTGELAAGVLGYMFLRPLFSMLIYYRKEEPPLFAFGLSFPLRLAAWLIVLDYSFYAYHRSVHEIPFLWRVHKKHHDTRHPTAVLALYSSDTQELLEILLLPLLASLVVPMHSFSEQWLVLCYTMYVEMLGHSGIRARWKHPVLGWLLEGVAMGLTVEDHDIHHRFGKAGQNYGKQTRIWDRLFGTCAERIETRAM